VDPLGPVSALRHFDIHRTAMDFWSVYLPKYVKARSLTYRTQQRGNKFDSKKEKKNKKTHNPPLTRSLLVPMPSDIDFGPIPSLSVSELR
jgi:hypothetical protein